MIVTIDGPSASGKSTVSRLLARRLGISHLDTGAIYRALALAMEWDGFEQTEESKIKDWLSSLELDVSLENGRFIVLIDGKDVEPFIRNEKIGEKASFYSAYPVVRDFLLEMQRKAGEKGDLVADGRDMGTVVFPKADYKFFLTASTQERSRRRQLELMVKNPGVSLESVREKLQKRDKQDQNRAVSPLKPASDAVEIDTTDLDLEQVIAKLREHIQFSMAG